MRSRLHSKGSAVMANQRANWSIYLSEQFARALEAVARSKQLLQDASPDTFLGRKTRESPPSEHPMEQADIPRLLGGVLRKPD